MYTCRKITRTGSHECRSRIYIYISTCLFIYMQHAGRQRRCGRMNAACIYIYAYIHIHSYTYLYTFIHIYTGRAIHI